jgi:hypothetical protein
VSPPDPAAPRTYTISNIQNFRKKLNFESDLMPIFEWLKENNVKTILSLIVVDAEEPSHADAEIEECVKGFQVEEWDWQKVDLCTDVIYNTAKTAEEVSLCSSGNNAVLVGWSSKAGLARLPNVSL